MSELENYTLHGCPFCGADSLTLEGNASLGDLHIRCVGCGARGPESPFVWAAVDQWEARTSWPEEEAVTYTITNAGWAKLRGGV